MHGENHAASYLSRRRGSIGAARRRTMPLPELSRHHARCLRQYCGLPQLRNVSCLFPSQLICRMPKSRTLQPDTPRDVSSQVVESNGKRFVIIHDDKYKRARLASDESSTSAADSTQQPGAPGSSDSGKKQPSLQFHGSAECISQGAPPGEYPRANVDINIGLPSKEMQPLVSNRSLQFRGSAECISQGPPPGELTQPLAAVV